MNEPVRCGWCGTDPQYVAYHDSQWGRPETDSLALFEKLCLDGQQAGLSWLIILRKTESYRAAFDNFDPHKIALYDQEKIEQLLQDPGIVRNRLKVNSIIKNAKGYLKLQQQGIEFSDFIWSFVGHRQVVNRPQTLADIATTSAESEAMSKALKKAGFTFVGPTITYAFMQACGLINDHLLDCHCRQACMQLQ
ncbi:DNA-3-methyladenine glycosylase I [Ferrimonas senticii]|uniref:DNA-3-methyladenine glycosylase I n=1 Tax=Ferrimonas senticii TaxID=394566 RepID=UPI00041D0D65|nr:DNA-3-methyladenine glycosylase I [Ferrimonas senticii]